MVKKLPKLRAYANGKLLQYEPYYVHETATWRLDISQEIVEQIGTIHIELRKEE